MAFRAERNATEGVTCRFRPAEVLPWFEPCPSSLAHLLGMFCGLGAVLLLPTRVTMRRSSLIGA